MNDLLCFFIYLLCCHDLVCMCMPGNASPVLLQLTLVHVCIYACVCDISWICIFKCGFARVLTLRFLCDIMKIFHDFLNQILLLTYWMPVVKNQRISRAFHSFHHSGSLLYHPATACMTGCLMFLWWWDSEWTMEKHDAPLVNLQNHSKGLGKKERAKQANRLHRFVCVTLWRWDFNTQKQYFVAIAL